MVILIVCVTDYLCNRSFAKLLCYVRPLHASVGNRRVDMLGYRFEM